ncbi:MuF-C-terminal domain-containing protein [Treponema putidum]|uniref:MuF-C-terminal domain-containing protein n=1 Tax=Treponema putidum TaxID=221027 RepID=UPI002102B4C4|nr:hypothetical protein [Treponema putidum]UTY30490.1 hypothetical protein E4N75_02205 [Treponema putidum]
MGKYDRENPNFYSDLLDEIKQNFNLDYEGAETALLLIRERALSLELSLAEYMKTYHPQGFSEKDNSLSDEYKGYVQFLSGDAKALIRCGKKADFSTFTHEVAHSFRRQLSGGLKETAEKAFKVENGQWTELQEEAFAVGFEEYIRLRLTENEELEKVFEKGSLYMQRVYNGLDRIIELNPEIIKVYDQMFTHGRFQFNQEEFNKTIDDIANFKDETAKFASSHVYLGMTPPIYQELGFERLPVMATAFHLKTAMMEKGNDPNINYHGIPAEMLKQIPEAIKKPLIIMQSQKKSKNEDIIAVIELKDKKGRQIIVPFSPNKKGNFNDIEIDINLAKSIYGRNNFNKFVQEAFKENRILYLNKKSRDIVPPQVQYPRNYKPQLLYNNIAKYHKAVKQKNPDFNILYQKQAYYSGGQFEFDFLNDPIKKEEQKIQEKPIQAQNENKSSLNTEHKQNAGIIVQTDKIKILNNTEMERVQIFFPGAPNEEIRNDLKSHGWKWSPRNFCWQRFNTENGIKDAMRVFDRWYKEKSLEKSLQTENTSKTDIPLNKEIVLTKEEYANAQKLIPPLQYKTTLSYSKYSEDADFFKKKIKDVSSIYQNAPALYKGKKENGQTPLLFRYFHPSGTEQYICEIDKEEGLVYSFGILNGDLQSAEWGYQILQDITSIKNMEMDYHIPEGMTVERMLYNKYPHHFPDPDKPTAKNKEKDYNETEQNKEKQNGKNNQGVQNRERNRNSGDGGERNNDEGRNTGLNDSGLKNGRTETIEFKKIQHEINAIEAMKTKAILQTYTNIDYLNSKKPLSKGLFINNSIVYDETPALKKEIEDLKKFIISKNNPEYDTRYFMQKMGVCNGFLCATDGKVLKRIKLAGLEHLENRSCVKVEYKDKKIIISYDDEHKQEKLKNEYPPAANIVPEGKTIIKFDNEKVKNIIQNLETWDILKPQPKKEPNWDKNILPLEVKERGIYIGNEKIGIAENTSQDKFFMKINYLHLKKALTNEKNTIFRLDDREGKINGSIYYKDILHQETEYSSTIIKLMERDIKVPEIFNSKELSTFLNTKAPIHKKIENSIER